MLTTFHLCLSKFSFVYYVCISVNCMECICEILILLFLENPKHRLYRMFHKWIGKLLQQLFQLIFSVVL